MINSHKISCSHQGPGKMNPVSIGGYDIIRKSNNPSDISYWQSSGISRLFDAALNQGQGGEKEFYNLLKISKGAKTTTNSLTKELKAKVMLDVDMLPITFEYYPSRPMDVIFVLDVSSSMISHQSRKMVKTKRAMVQMINLLWKSNKDTKITIIPYGRDAMIPKPTSGLFLDYLGTLFKWHDINDDYNIGQLLGYRNQPFVPPTDMAEYIKNSIPYANDVEFSLYNYYKYYKIQYSDIYNEDGSAKQDTILDNYIKTVYKDNPNSYKDNHIEAVAAGIPLNTEQLWYSMNDKGYSNNTILENAIWAIPYAIGTNTEAGLHAAHSLLRMPGFTQSDDMKQHSVILITDGKANKSINKNYEQKYALLSSKDSDFIPDLSNGNWRYYLNLNQTLPGLLEELNRAATAEEVTFAMENSYLESTKIKSSEDGNALLFVLGIDLEAPIPGPYEKADIIDILSTAASTPKYLRQINERSFDEESNEILKKLVNDMFLLPTGLRITVVDTINTSLFEYVPGTLRISGKKDNYKLKAKSSPDIIDYMDPEYTVYKKPPLLPDVSDDNIKDGVITVDFEEDNFKFASIDSGFTVHLSYELKPKNFSYGNHLHTNNDCLSAVYYIEPDHLKASSSEVVFNRPVKKLLFHTPIISYFPDYTIRKFVSDNPLDVNHKSIKIKSLQKAYYRILVDNHSNKDITFPLLVDVNGVCTIEDAVKSNNANILAQDFTVKAQGSAEFTFSENVKLGDKITNYAILTTDDRILYDDAYVYFNNEQIRYKIEYLEFCTNRKIHHDGFLDTTSCDEIMAYTQIIKIPHYKFVLASPEVLLPCDCEQKKILTLYYIPSYELRECLEEYCNNKCNCNCYCCFE